MDKVPSSVDPEATQSITKTPSALGDIETTPNYNAIGQEEGYNWRLDAPDFDEAQNAYRENHTDLSPEAFQKWYMEEWTPPPAAEAQAEAQGQVEQVGSKKTAGIFDGLGRILFPRPNLPRIPYTPPIPRLPSSGSARVAPRAPVQQVRNSVSHGMSREEEEEELYQQLLPGRARPRGSSVAREAAANEADIEMGGTRLREGQAVRGFDARTGYMPRVRPSGSANPRDLRARRVAEGNMDTGEDEYDALLGDAAGPRMRFNERARSAREVRAREPEDVGPNKVRRETFGDVVLSGRNNTMTSVEEELGPEAPRGFSGPAAPRDETFDDAVALERVARGEGSNALATAVGGVVGSLGVAGIGTALYFGLRGLAPEAPLPDAPGQLPPPVEGGGGAVGAGSGIQPEGGDGEGDGRRNGDSWGNATGVIWTVQRPLSFQGMFMHVQKTLEITVPGMDSTEWVISTDRVPNMFPGNVPSAGYGFGTPWRYIPNQTGECYLSPKDCSLLFQRCGPEGGFRFVECGVDVFNVRTYCRLPRPADYLISADKPYWKFYEDKDRLLFGHTIAGVANEFNSIPSDGYWGRYAPKEFFYPCINSPSFASVGLSGEVFGTGNSFWSTSRVMPRYHHSYPWDGLTDMPDDYIKNPTFQLNLESTGGVSWLAAGSTVSRRWKVGGCFMSIHRRDDISRLSDEFGVYINAAVDGPRPQTLCFHIGRTGAYHIVNRYDGSLGQVAGRGTAYNSMPPMCLLWCPYLTGEIFLVNDFSIETEMQATCTYTAVIEITPTMYKDYGGAVQKMVYDVPPGGSGITGVSDLALIQSEPTFHHNQANMTQVFVREMVPLMN